VWAKHLYTKNGTDVYKMAHINQKWHNVLELYFENPGKRFSVREISKRVGVPSSSVQRYLQELKKKGLVSEDNGAGSGSYFKFLKSFSIVNKMYEYGLIDYLKSELNPSVIIVFGSVQKGEYDNESDIDVFVETSVKKKLDLKDFEKKLGHGVQLVIEGDIDKLHKNLYNNVVNGIKLYGSLRVSRRINTSWRLEHDQEPKKSKKKVLDIK